MASPESERQLVALASGHEAVPLGGGFENEGRLAQQLTGVPGDLGAGEAWKADYHNHSDEEREEAEVHANGVGGSRSQFGKPQVVSSPATSFNRGRKTKIVRLRR